MASDRLKKGPPFSLAGVYVYGQGSGRGFRDCQKGSSFVSKTSPLTFW